MAFKFNPFTGNLDIVLDTPVSIANGGTGQITAVAAFDALSPLSTRGDLLTRDASNNVRLAKGTSGQYLTIGATDPSWAAVPAGFVAMGGGAAAGWSPVANTTYYFAGNLTLNPGTVDGNTENVPLAATATLRAAVFVATVFGTKATAAQNVTVSVRFNHASDISIGAGDWSAQTNRLSVSGLSQAFATTDPFSIKMITPAVWTVTPTVVFVQGMLYFDRP